MNPVLVVLSLSVASLGLSVRAVEPMLPVLASEFSVTVPVAAQVITVYSLLYATGQFAHGPLGDRYGKLPVIGIMLLADSCAFLGCALSKDLASLTLWRAAAGSVSAAPFILGMAYIGDTVPLERRQTTIAQFVTGNVIGHACGPLLAGTITDALGWRAMFFFLTGLFVVVGAIMMVMAFSRRGTEARAAVSGNPFATYLQVLKLPRVQVLCWAAAVEAFFFFGAYAYIGAMLKERFDQSFTLIGIALAGLGLGGLAFNTSIRWLLKRMKPQRMVLAGGVGCGSIYVAIALLPVWWPIYVLMMGLGFTFYFVHNVLQTRATEAAPKARGVGVSVFGITWTIGQSLGVATSGAGIAVFGFTAMIALFGVGFAALGIWMRLNLEKLP